MAGQAFRPRFIFAWIWPYRDVMILGGVTVWVDDLLFTTARDANLNLCMY